MIVQIKWIWIRISKWMILLIYQEADAKSKPDSVVDNGGDKDMTADLWCIIQPSYSFILFMKSFVYNLHAALKIE